MASEHSPQAANRFLDGDRYELIRRLGAGGMGEVFLAKDHQKQKNVVIKVPHKALFKDAGFAARFRREVKSLIQLRHPNIVRTLDVGVHKGLPYVVMRYLAGGSLEDRISNGPLSESSLIHWLPSIATALDYVHQQDFIHRDIKPANIFFDSNDRAYLGDFGIAKTTSSQDTSETHAAKLTGTGMAMGTPDYMAPELIMSDDVDHRVDQYALAVTVYQVLSGTLPFEGPTPAAVMVKQSTTPAPSLAFSCPEASDTVVNSVDRALSKMPDHRFESCGDFAACVLGENDPANNQASTTAKPRGGTTRASKSRTKVVADSRVETTSNTKTLDSSIRPPEVPQKLLTRLLYIVVISLLLIGTGVYSGLFFKTSAITETANTDSGLPPEPTSTGEAPSAMQSISAAKERLAFDQLKPIQTTEETQLSFTVATNRLLDDNEYLAVEVGPKEMLIDTSTGQVSWTPAETDGPGVFEVTLVAKNKETEIAVARTSLNIYVIENNRPPSVELEPVALTAQPGDTFQYQVRAVDADLPAQKLTFAMRNDLQRNCSIDADTGRIVWDIPTDVDLGENDINLSVTDSAGATTPAIVRVTIIKGISSTAADVKVAMETPVSTLLSEPRAFHCFRGKAKEVVSHVLFINPEGSTNSHNARLSTRCSYRENEFRFFEGFDRVNFANVAHATVSDEVTILLGENVKGKPSKFRRRRRPSFPVIDEGDILSGRFIDGKILETVEWFPFEPAQSKTSSIKLLEQPGLSFRDKSTNRIGRLSFSYGNKNSSFNGELRFYVSGSSGKLWVIYDYYGTFNSDGTVSLGITSFKRFAGTDAPSLRGFRIDFIYRDGKLINPSFEISR